VGKWAVLRDVGCEGITQGCDMCSGGVVAIVVLNGVT
jgi:hypothetical protein